MREPYTDVQIRAFWTNANTFAVPIENSLFNAKYWRKVWTNLEPLLYFFTLFSLAKKIQEIQYCSIKNLYFARTATQSGLFPRLTFFEYFLTML